MAKYPTRQSGRVTAKPPGTHRPPLYGDNEQRRDIQLIKIAQQQLGMDDATYRAMLWTVARVKSCTELDFVGRRNVLDHLKKCGFKVTAGKNAGKPRPVPAADKAALVGKIRALLIALDHKPDAYADGVSRKMFGIERFEWCSPPQLGKLIAALNYSLARQGKPKATIPSPSGRGAGGEGTSEGN